MLLPVLFWNTASFLALLFLTESVLNSVDSQWKVEGEEWDDRWGDVGGEYDQVRREMSNSEEKVYSWYDKR